MIELSEEQIERYSRHILLQDVGLEGQEKLLNAKVLIIGTGGLGSPVSLYLAAAGVGHIGIVDADVVDLSLRSIGDRWCMVVVSSCREMLG